MNHERYERLKRVFHEAVEAPAGRRADLIREMCSGDAELEAEALLLLGQLDSAEGFLDAPTGIPPPGSGGVIGAPVNDGGTIAVEQPGGLRFASYTVLRTLGRGGMGVVYLAEQDGTRRTVALKVVRAGLATPGALQRFAFEAQVLGRLNHPGIAQIYDVGAADTGHGPQPYFAMELVDGQTITEFALERSLSLPDRLALLAQVCDAVEYAHVKGVIHRDLKPGNILVDRAGRAKVLDFGVARATTPALDSSLAGLPSLNTQTGQLVGTLPYMSPEQISGDPDDTDTRSDVYALGVIGYELLAGRPAFDVEKLPPLEVARVVKETEPAPLSSLSRACRGDIETVIRAAMEKDRERRYQSAAALAADIRRYLDNEPIEARPASAWYQLHKMARRHRTLVGGVAALALTLTVCAVWMGILAERERAARLRAERAAEREVESRRAAVTAAEAAGRDREVAVRQSEVARAVTRFFVEDWAESITSREAGPDFKVRDMLDGVASSVDKSLSGEPETAATMHVAVGRMFQYLTLFEKGAEHFARAAALRSKLGPEQEPELWAAENLLAQCDRELGRLAEARTIQERVLAGRSRVFGEESAETLASRMQLAVLLEDERRFAEARQEYRAVLETATRCLGPAHRVTLDAMGCLGSVCAKLGELDEAVRLCRTALEGTRREFGADHPSALDALNALIVVMQEQGDLEGASTLATEHLALTVQAFGQDHPSTNHARLLLGTIALEMEDLPLAATLLEDCYERFRAHFGASHDRTLSVRQHLVTLRQAQGRAEEAAVLARGLMEDCASRFGAGALQTIHAANVLTTILYAQRDLDGALAVAEATFRDAVPLGPGHPDVLDAAQNVVSILLEMGRADRAISRAIALALQSETEFGPTSPRTLAARRLQIESLAASGRLEEADGVASACIAALKSEQTPDAALIVRMTQSRAAANARCGKFDVAVSLLDEAFSLAQSAGLPASTVNACRAALEQVRERATRTGGGDGAGAHK